MTYRERIISVINQLSKWGVPHNVKASGACGYAVVFPWTDGRICCDEMTYSEEPDAVETFGFPWDNNSVSILSTYEATCKVIDLYKELNK